MPSDPQKNAAALWLLKAKEDFSWAEYNVKGGFFTQVCFIAQQATEKALKAYLRYSGEAITGKLKTHDLLILEKACEAFDTSFADIVKDVQILNQYYAPTRYPEVLSLAEYTKDIAEEALTIARRVVNFVEEKMQVMG